jgi:nitrogen fixation/metabolism regulation signal transduction histidine kinase
MKKKNERITARVVTLKQFLVIFAAILFTCGNYHIFYISSFENRSRTFTAFEGMLLVLAFSLAGAVLIGIIKQAYLDKPIRTIAEATKKVAGGDFGVRIPPSRNDGKIDHIGALIEDFNAMAEELSSIETFEYGGADWTVGAAILDTPRRAD